jgi:hypothetical protein
MENNENRSRPRRRSASEMRHVAGGERVRLHRQRNRVNRNNGIIENNQNRSRSRRRPTSEEQRAADNERVRLLTERNRNRLNNIQLNDHEYYLGSMSELCKHCSAKHFKDEKIQGRVHSFNDCCSHGSVELNDPRNFPNELKSLFDGSHEKSNIFSIELGIITVYFLLLHLMLI